MKKILLSILTIGLVVSVAFGATRAFFSDTATSAITVSSGNVNLRLSKDGSGWGDSLSFDLPNNWAPGDTYSMYVWTKNIGTSGLENLFVTGNNLGGPNPGFSDVIHITDVAYTDRDPATGGAYWVHPASGTYYATVFGDQTGVLTLRELASGVDDNEDPAKMNFCWGTCGVHGDYLPANSGRIQKFYIEFTFDENAGPEWQDKSVSFDLLFKGTDEPGDFVWYPGDQDKGVWMRLGLVGGDLSHPTMPG